MPPAGSSGPSGSSIQVLDRLASLLETLAQAEHPLPLKHLAAETDLHPSTAFRILASAQRHDWVARRADGAYVLGAGLRRLGNQAAPLPDWLQTSYPALEALRDRVGETVNLTVQQEDEVVYVARVLSQRMMRVEQLIGSRAPLHVTAVGKLMLAAAGPEAIDAYAQRTGLPRYTEHTRVDAGILRREAEAALASGVAFDNEEAEPGVGCIGTLIRDRGGRVLAGLSISAPIARRCTDWGKDLITTAAQITAQIGAAEPSTRDEASPTEVQPG